MRLPLAIAIAVAAFAAQHAAAQTTTIRFVSASPAPRSEMLQRIGVYAPAVQRVARADEPAPDPPMPPTLDDFLKADNGGSCSAAPSCCATPSCCSSMSCCSCGPRFPLLHALLNKHRCAASCCSMSCDCAAPTCVAPTCAAPVCAAPSCAAPTCDAPTCGVEPTCGCVESCGKCHSWRPGQWLFGMLDRMMPKPCCKSACIECCNCATCGAEPVCGAEPTCGCAGPMLMPSNMDNDEVPAPPVPTTDAAAWLGR